MRQSLLLFLRKNRRHLAEMLLASVLVNVFMLALPLFLAAVALLGVLAIGRLEAPAVQLLSGARGAFEGEWQMMAGVLARLRAFSNFF